MIASKSIRRIWILGFEIVICIMIGIIASNALAAQATLAWDPNTESDLAGYRIHHGTTSGSYTVHTDVHNVTSYTVTGLTAGQTYYFAATAYDASGNESGYSNPVSYRPGVNRAPDPCHPAGASRADEHGHRSASATAPTATAGIRTIGAVVFPLWGRQSHGWAAAGSIRWQARDSLGLESACCQNVTIPKPAERAPAAAGPIRRSMLLRRCPWGTGTDENRTLPVAADRGNFGDAANTHRRGGLHPPVATGTPWCLS
jgi:hypothetical protein